VGLHGVGHDATVAWRYDDRLWVVAIESPLFEPVEARANDSFEALCLVRDELEPHGWRISVVEQRAEADRLSGEIRLRDRRQEEVDRRARPAD